MKMQKNSNKPRITKCYGVVVTDAKGHQYILTGTLDLTKEQPPHRLKFFKDSIELCNGGSLVTTTLSKWRANNMKYLARDLVETMRCRPAISKPYKVEAVPLRVISYPTMVEVLA